MEITLRCTQGRYLLRPSERLNSLVIGVLARGQQQCRVSIHACAFLSNHAHLLVSVASQKHLSAFMNFVNSNVAREVNLIHDWSGGFWARRYRSIPVIGGEEIQVARLRYILSQGTKEGLVDSPMRWPGINTAKALANGEDLRGIWIDRTALNKARRTLPAKQVRPIDFEEELTLSLSPLPCWQNLDALSYQRNILNLIREIESSAHQDREGKPIVGRNAILRQHPHTRNQKLKTSPVPVVHAPSKRIRLEFLATYRNFTQVFRAAAERLRAGDLTAEFPVGSFPPALSFVEAIQTLKPG